MTLKIGTETGSVVNYLMSGSKGMPAPEVGMGATILMWSDRHAATIVKVTKTQVHVKRDKAIRIDKNGVSETQEYRFEPDPDAPVEIFRWTKKGLRKAGGGAALRIGDRDEYCDPYF